MAQVLPIEGARNPAPPKAEPTNSSASEGLLGQVDPNTFKIGPEDTLSVMVYGNPQLTSRPKVRPDGMISLVLIDEQVQVNGLTVNQVKELLVKLYGQIIVAPSITVDVASAMSRTYSLAGMFAKTGTVPLLKPTRVSEAIVNAGAFQPFANEKNVRIIRGEHRFKFNYKDWVNGKNPAQNIYLEPGDTLYVD